MNVAPRRGCATGYRGVSLRNGGHGYVAEIVLGNRRIYLGFFHTPEEAARSYDAKARELFGEYARPNFPDGNLS